MVIVLSSWTRAPHHFWSYLVTKSIHGRVSIDPQHLDQYSIKISIDTRSTFWLTFGRELTTNYCWRSVDQLSIKMLIKCRFNVDWVSIKMLIECWLRCWWGDDWRLSKSIDCHAAADAFNIHHYPFDLGQVTLVDKTLSMVFYSYNQSISQSVNWSVNQSLNRSINKHIYTRWPFQL